jgi:UDP-N-acetylmuramoyl-L-alanyl-D-glutamate--2,6-diaminopimelate ligase
MSLATLLEGWCDCPPEATILGLSLDSRRVRPGEAFVAVEGERTHGMAHASEAISRGATVIIHDGLSTCPTPGVPQAVVSGLGGRLSRLASRFYHAPSDQLVVAGITGTNGKTSTAHFIAQAWQRSGGHSGLIGTIGYGPLDALQPADMTTPDPISLQAMLASCSQQGIENVAMEVSSHALAQGRCADVAFDAAVLTNLSRDHLDYHGSMEAYAAAKRRLFTDCQPRFVIINQDDPFGRSLIGELEGRAEVLSYGTGSSAELQAAVLDLDSSGMTMDISSPWGGGVVHTGLMGAFNVSNLLASAGTLALLGMPWSQVMHQLEIMHPVPGRMHCMGGELQQPVVVVDYAHTPDALRQALLALRAHLHGNLTCVFGCGGERDRGKRPMMAQVAESLADRIVLTTDNPRNESPDSIFSDMRLGLENPDRARVIPDRGTAIRTAIEECEYGDIVLVAGKGHESWQETAGQRIPFSDSAAVRSALEDAA